MKHVTSDVFMQIVTSWVRAYRRFEGTRSYNLQDMKCLADSSVALFHFQGTRCCLGSMVECSEYGSFFRSIMSENPLITCFIDRHF